MFNSMLYSQEQLDCSFYYQSQILGSAFCLSKFHKSNQRLSDETWIKKIWNFSNSSRSKESFHLLQNVLACQNSKSGTENALFKNSLQKLHFKTIRKVSPRLFQVPHKSSVQSYI